jgi:hypothetical protein
MHVAPGLFVLATGNLLVYLCREPYYWSAIYNKSRDICWLHLIRETKWSAFFFKALLSRESSKLVSARRVHLVLGTSCILSCGTETVFKATSCGSEARLLVLLFEKEDPGPCRVMFMSGSKSCRYTEVVHYRLLVSPGRLPKSANVRSRNCRSTYVA